MGFVPSSFRFARELAGRGKMRHRSTLAAALLAFAAASAAAQTDVMFVTSASGTGNLSTWPQATAGLHGIAAGNSICQNLAAAAGLANASTFQAWLSDAKTDAACNIRARGGHPPSCGSLLADNPGPWARTDGLPFARNVASLTAPEILTPPLFDEHGNRVALDARVWTGTSASGRWIDGETCGSDVDAGSWNDANAQGTRGDASLASHSWTDRVSEACDLPAHLYCFQHSIFGGPPFVPFEHEGRLVFRTSKTYVGDLELSAEAHGQPSFFAGDAICQTRALAGGLPHPSSFRAWLSTTFFDAADRLADAGALKRPDGLAIATSKADLLDGELAVPITESELLTYGVSNAWTGTRSDGLAGDFTCGDWTDGASSGDVGITHHLTSWSGGGEDICTHFAALYCISTTPILFWTGFEESGGGLWRWSAVESE
jgi:hypothetical protein